MAGRVQRTLRVLGIVLWTLLLSPLAVMAALLAPFGPGVRHAFGSRVTRWWSRGLLRCLGVHLKVEGPRPPRGSLIVSNHLGYLDILVLSVATPTTFVAKRELGQWPFLGPCMRMVGTLLIDRESLRDTSRMVRAMQEVLGRKRSVTLFAEGTSWSGGRLLPFKRPLFAAPAELDIPVVPAALHYATPGAGPGAAGEDGGSPHLEVCWWGDMPFFAHFRRLLRLPRIEARVRFGEPVRGLRDRKELASRMEREVAALFEPIPGAPDDLSEAPRLGLGAAQQAEAGGEEPGANGAAADSGDPPSHEPGASSPPRDSPTRR